MKYPKINTLFKRDDKGIIMPSEYSMDTFEYLKDCKWECTEKIDGTNIRIEITKDIDNISIDIKGRTDKAIIPTHLYEKLSNIFNIETVKKILKEDALKTDITIFGEGYGYKIQEGYNYIQADADFILFDININGYWMPRTVLEEMANLMDIKIVPIIGYYNLEEAIKLVQKGFISTISQNRAYRAEGLILKPLNGLLYRDGNRIITKLKTSDFNKYFNSINP